jgi:exopolyphosphatase/guanosine-5'-triphosphate,3'-diphosphate pyrophosphatase
MQDRRRHLALLTYDSLAAVDLGSNSFHLQIGRVVDDQVYPLDSLREPVRLGAGLTRDKKLDRATQVRALDALSRFGERLRGFPPGAVRAVGTNTLRVAKNAGVFLAEAEAALGFPIEVVFGREEARLIYLGVSHSLPPSGQRRLVVDVGGGSTEFIIGTGFEPALMESLPMGCVSWTLRFFPDGRIDKAAMRKAELAASTEIERIVRAYRKAGWDEAVGSSGTVKTIAAVLAGSGWASDGITRDGLDRLRAHLVKAGDATRLALPMVREERATVLAGGTAVLGAVFEALALDHMAVSEGALRTGVLYDLLGRVQHQDQRDATVRVFMRRHGVDQGQAERVHAFADGLLRQVAPRASDNDRAMLRWAAFLHEIGLVIAQAGYHKHSAYILSNADMPGFSGSEQARLARLVLAHRGKLGKVESLPARSADWPLIFALRTAAALYRSRVDVDLPSIGARATETGFVLTVPDGWLDEHPLTAAALDAEAEEWRMHGLKLEARPAADRQQAAAS